MNFRTVRRLREGRAEVAADEARSQLSQNELTARLRQAHAQLTTALASSRAYQTDILGSEPQLKVEALQNQAR